jgi:tetratricopeptide (TPR) repeat protein
MKNAIKIHVALFAILIASTVLAQKSTVDSLLRALRVESIDSAKINLYIQLGDIYQKSNPDSNRYYTEKALELIKIQVKGKWADQYRLLEGNYHFRIGETYHEQKKHEKAVEFYHKSIKSFEHAQKSKKPSTVEEAKKGIINGYFFLGRLFAEKENSDRAIEFYNESIRLRQEISDFTGIARCHNNIGIVYYYQGNFDKAIESYEKSIKIREQLNDNTGISNCYLNMGLILTDQGKFDKAIESYLDALKIKEELHDKLGIAHCYNNIGNLHADRGSPKKAIEYYLMALKIREELDDKEGISGCYTNIGLAHSELDDYNKAIHYYQKAIPIYTELADEMGLADNYNNLGIAFRNKSEFQTAIGYFEKSLTIREKLGDVHGITAVTSNISSLHLSLANGLEKSGSMQKAAEHRQLSLKYGTKAMEMAKNIGAIPQQKAIAENLVKAYKSTGNISKALHYAELSMDLRDSLFKQEKTKALAEMETRYNAEQKQREIENQNLQIENQRLALLHANWETRKQRITMSVLVLAIIVVVVVAFYTHKSKTKQIETNKLLQQFNAEILQQKEEIITQSEEIDFQNRKITSSLEYAGLIQQSVLTDAKSIESVFKEYFLFYKPCEIVSGDFYLVRQNESSIYIAIADCTGHGVPGALISMLGYAFLNEIVHRKIASHANLALEEMRAKVKDALNQTGKRYEQDDGIEIAFCIINKATRKLSYSGANIPLWLVRHEDNEMEPILEIFEADSQPVGVYVREKPFTEKTVQLYEGDILYVFTDGLISQFGGPKGSRFMEKQLKELILSNSHLNLNEQVAVLEKNFSEWTGSNEQLDDVLAFGAKI